MTDEKYMRLALDEAKRAYEMGEVPVGAIVVKNGEVISSACNYRENGKDSTAHAEIVAIREACERLGSWHLDGCTLYVTLEPCPMCAGAVINSRIARVVFGAYDLKAGSFGSLINLNFYPFNHKPETVGGVLSEESRELLSDFFSRKRNKI